MNYKNHKDMEDKLLLIGTKLSNEVNTMKTDKIDLDKKMKDINKEVYKYVDNKIDKTNKKINDYKDPNVNKNMNRIDTIKTDIVSVNEELGKMVDYTTISEKAFEDIRSGYQASDNEIKDQLYILNEEDVVNKGNIANNAKRIDENKSTIDDLKGLSSDMTNLERIFSESNLYFRESLDALRAQITNTESKVYPQPFWHHKIMNHRESKYITYLDNLSSTDSLFVRTSSGKEIYWFACEPKDNFLISYVSNESFRNMKEHIHFFTGMYGNTNTIYDNKIHDNKSRKNHFVFDESINISEGKYDDISLGAIKSIHVPAHLNLIVRDTDNNIEMRLRDTYPSQIFINRDIYNRTEFFERLNGLRNGIIEIEIYDYKKTVSSVFLRNKHAPFSVIEFQQNEVVHLVDLMNFTTYDGFITNNGRKVEGHIIYIPYGTSIELLDIYHTEVHEITHTTQNLNKYKDDKEIKTFRCNEKGNVTLCVVHNNVIRAMEKSMTIILRINSVDRDPTKVVVFKVI